MPRHDFGDLQAFIAVARARSFTRAAAQLRVTQPALSYTIRTLEEKLGVQLLVRSTRGVTPTEAGQRLLQRLAPEFDAIEAEIQALGEFRDEPVGTIRITAIDYAIRSTLWPKLAAFLPHYPKIKVELINEYESVDIVARGYDAGVRFGQELAQDMISVRIGPNVRNVVVGSPSYFAGRTPPGTPHDLTEHMVCPCVAQGQLIPVLEDWCPVWPGFHLYYPNRRQPSCAMSLLVDALRYG